MRLCVDLEARDIALGLALDEILLESARAGGGGVVRLWVSERSVVIGRSQSVEAEFDREAARGFGIPVARRISGGGAVYQYPGNLNLSLIMADSRELGSVDEAFNRLAGSLARGLREVLGVPVGRNGRGLFIGERKISGFAQARRGSAVLLHATLLVWPDAVQMPRVLRALRPGYAPSGTRSHAEPTTTLSSALGRQVELAEAADAVVRGLSLMLGVRWTHGAATEGEQERAIELAETRYRSPTWTESL